MEYYLALKRETWHMNVKDIMLREISQWQKDKYCRVSGILHNIHRGRKSHGGSRDEQREKQRTTA
jgi:hypothetical protein